MNDSFMPFQLEERLLCSKTWHSILKPKKHR